MLRSTNGAEINLVRRTVPIVLAYDLAATTLHVVIFAWLDFVDLGVVAVTTIVRVLVWILALGYLLNPIRRWQRRTRESPEREIVALENRLQHLGKHFAYAYVGAWLACQGLWVWLAHIGAPSPLPLGPAELTAAVAIISTQLISPLLLGPVFEGAVVEIHSQVQHEIHARGLVTARVSRTIPGSVARLCVTLCVLLFIGLSGVANLWRIQGVRAATVNDQARLAQVSAAQVSAGGQPLEGVQHVAFSELPELLRAQVQPSSTFVAAYDIREGEAVAAAPLGDDSWMLAQTPADEQLLLYCVVILICAAVSPPIIWIVTRPYGQRLSAPLEQFSLAAQQFIETGELNTFDHLVPLRDDEVSRLSANFNGMLDILQSLSRAAEAVAAGMLTVEFDQPGELHEAFRGMLEQLNQMVWSLRETSLELASASAELIALSEAQDDAAQQQAAGIEHIDALVASLSTSAREIADNAEGVRDDAEAAFTTVTAMAEQTSALRERTTSVGDLLDVIREIAARSDLLALNGSLEATRAGESGRGFALVAAEMRRLAERVTGAVNEVESQVTNIDVAGNNTVSATERSRALAERNASAAAQIYTLTQRQSSDMAEAAAGSRLTTATVRKTALAISQTRAAAQGLDRHARALAHQLETFEIHEQPE